MGVYSTNRLQVSGINLDDIAANESYTGEIGIQKMLVESCENDMAIFEAILRTDMQHAVFVQEGAVLEAELASLNEASVKGIWETIKKGLTAFWAKIQSILDSFEKKFLSAVDAANKALLNKVKGHIEKKDLSKFTYTRRDETKHEDLKLEPIETKVEEAKNELNKEGMTEEYISTIIAKHNEGKLVKELLAAAFPGSASPTAESFAADYIKMCFGEPAQVTGMNPDVLKHYIEDLGTFVPTKKREWSKFKSDLKRNISKHMSDINKAEKAAKGGEGAEKAAKVAEAARIIITSWQTASSTVIGAEMQYIKVRATQARTVVTQAATYNPNKKVKTKEDKKEKTETAGKETETADKEVKTEAAIFEAIEEAVEMEINDLAMCY